MTAGAERRRQGMQLMLAAGSAWAIARASGLPDPAWAMMSTLIVMRPTAGATLMAGWDRIAGTVAGALCGLAGAASQSVLGTGAGLPTLALTLALSYAGSAAPAWRSAPITALIVTGAAALDGAGALWIAAVRVVQILIGIATALAVATLFLRVRADVRLRQGSRALLRGLAASLSRASAAASPPSTSPPSISSSPVSPSADSPPGDRQAGQRLREALDRLEALAVAADWSARGTGKRRDGRRGDPSREPLDPRTRGGDGAPAHEDPPTPPLGTHASRIEVLRRVVEDVGLLRRTLRSASLRGHGDRVGETIRTATRALLGVADDGDDARIRSQLDALQALADRCAHQGGAPSRLAGPLAALHDDLGVLRRD